jgi:hypothetical protein
VQKVLDTYASHQIWLSATPTAVQIEDNIHVPLNTARVWKLHTVVREMTGPITYAEVWQNYKSNVIATLRSLPRLSKVLVFVNTVREGIELSTMFGGKACVISGNSASFDVSAASIICATAVADVGLTLPDVDTVISMDIGFTVEESIEGARPFHFRLTPEHVQQRAGRTGRTNHGQALIYGYPGYRVPMLPASLGQPSAVLSLLKSGVSVGVLAQYCKPELVNLLGLDSTSPDCPEEVVDRALAQLARYSNNVSLLLRERAEGLALETATGEPPAVIDNARMGLIRESTSLPTSELVNTLLHLCGALGQLILPEGELQDIARAKVFDLSAKLQSNLKVKMPMPDPDIGEFGFPWETGQPIEVDSSSDSE